MPFDSNGNFTLDPGYVAVSGETITPSQHNPPLESLASGLSQTFVRDGRAAATGNWAMGGNRITNLGDSVDAQDAVTKSQLDLRAWKTIRDENLSLVGTYVLNNLGAYEKVRITGFIYPSVSGVIVMQVSTDNGTTWDTTGNYNYMLLSASPGATAPISGTQDAFPVSALNLVNNNILNGITFKLEFSRFNKPERTVGLIDLFLESTTNIGISTGGMRHLSPVVLNAFRIFGNGALSGHVLIEGVEG